MPTILILFGLKFRIYVRDHEPIHVHVISQDGEAKFKVGDEVTLKMSTNGTTESFDDYAIGIK